MKLMSSLNKLKNKSKIKNTNSMTNRENRQYRVLNSKKKVEIKL